MDDSDALRKAADKVHLGANRRHIFLCVGGKCAKPEEHEESWGYLKHRLRELGLVDAEQGVLRTKADCLRICVGGPIAVVYPEGIWYRFESQSDIDEILETHLQNGGRVERLMLQPDQLPPKH